MRQFRMRVMGCASVIAGLAAAALAGPRDTATFLSVNSDSLPGSTRSFAAAGGYQARWITIEGTLLEVQGATFGCEAIIRVVSPDGTQFIAQPLSVNNFVGTTSASHSFQLATPEPAAGEWYFTFMESLDDGAGADAIWNTVTITLNDGPPSAVDAGLLPNGRTRYPLVPIGTTEVKWYTFKLASDVSAGAGKFLDIDTEGSTLDSLQDAEVALFDASGRLIVHDGDDGHLNASQLTFGAGTRPAVGGGLPYDGRDGALPAGTYFLAVRAFGGTSPKLGWGWSGNSSTSGTLTVNISTNAGSSLWCPSDFDRNGITSIDDLFLYINAYFVGCP